MLLSTADKIKFKFLYMEKSHRELAVIFDTDVKNVHEIAKKLGIFTHDYDKNIKIETKKKTTL